MDKFTRLMSIIKKQCHSFMTESLRSLDISAAEAPFIKFIYEHQNCRQTDLSKAFACDKAHTHRIIGKLIDKKIIQEIPPSANIVLTKKGLSMIATIDHTLKQWVEFLCNGITKQEEEIALSILQRCADNASKIKTEKKND
ncbi:MAG: winged helix-turn-helix transcriptional regulator [Clostridia bacterium]|nr:winged helix-turn-helix transcriptional regulator [Clostridia bacterium]